MNFEHNVEYKDFIGFYRNVFPKGYCEHLISEFEKLQKLSVGSTRKESENALSHIKDDYHIFINFTNGYGIDHFKWSENGNNFEKHVREMFFNRLQWCFDDYSTKFSVLRESGNIRSSSMKLQKTSPGGGYHVFHSEQGEGSDANRVIVYSLYLNTIKNAGGETEFLYQKLRIEPEENLLLLWPASYTHAHRGNTVLGNENKYIVTGWFYFD